MKKDETILALERDLAEAELLYQRVIEDEKAGDVWSLIDLEKMRAAIKTSDDADLVVKATAELAGERARLKMQYEAKLARIAAKEKKMDYFFAGPLQGWAATNLPKNKKSIVLWNGTVGFRTKKATVKTENADQLREWAEAELPKALNFDRPPISTTIIKEWEKENGKLAPGRVEVGEEEVFYIKPAKPDDRKELKNNDE